MTCAVPLLSWALMFSGPTPERLAWLIDGWPRQHQCYASEQACTAAADAANVAFDMDKSERRASCEYRPPVSK